MKYCITISVKNAYPGALVVFRGLENIATIAELGYDGIELALYDKDNINPVKLRKLLHQYHLELPVISTGQIFTMRAAWFSHPDREIRAKAIRIFKGIIETAAEFGAMVNISRVRGYIHEGETLETAMNRLTACLEEISTYAAQYCLDLVLEQMNRYETNYLNSAAEVGEYIKKTGIPNLKIHADLFHMNIEDTNISGTLERYRDLLGYIHFADSNRLSPGKGNMDFATIIATLKRIVYNGWIGLEVLPHPDPYSAAACSIKYLRDLDKKLEERTVSE